MGGLNPFKKPKPVALPAPIVTPAPEPVLPTADSEAVIKKKKQALVKQSQTSGRASTFLSDKEDSFG